MINLKCFCKPIQQAENHGVTEKAECNAIKFDDEDGFVKSLDNNYATDHRIDYFEIIEKGLIMIEVKDLRLRILKKYPDKEPTTNELKSIFDNLKNKFRDSLKIINKEIKSDLIPVSNYLVWKNDTDTILMDRYLPREFKDKPYNICKTSEICGKLNIFTSRLCQD